MKNTDPVLASTLANLTFEQKIKIHKHFLDKAKKDENKTFELYGLFYLLTDYYHSANYVEANKCLLKATDLVAKNNNTSWETALCFKKALLLTVQNDIKGALEQYKLAHTKSIIAKDSLYMAESLEQISAVYGVLDQYDKAELYFKKALPLLKKFSGKRQLALAYNNYSNLKSYEKKNTEALTNIDFAIKVIHEINDPYIETMYQNNKATIYTDLKQFDKAESILKISEQNSLKNNWKDRQTQTYACLAVLYEKWGKFELSLDYYKKYYEQTELINGKDIKIKIASLEAENLKSKKEIELKDNQLKLIKYKKNIYLLISIIFLVILLFIATLFYWKKQKDKSKLEFDKRIRDLNELTQSLILKNKKLLNQRKLIKIEHSNDEIKTENDSVLRTKILTDSDWLSFKTNFETAYPNYINKIRKNYPKITAAEERLFLCLKLNLNNKEVASILGISNESVKKSRNRLRKRIGLSLEEKLNDYIRNY